MKRRMVAGLLLGLAFVLTLTMSVRSDVRQDRDRKDKDCVVSDHHEDNLKTPVKLIGVIPVPGLPIASADIAWVDPGTERYYMADRSNAGVDIIDSDDDVWVGRVGGMAGALTSGGGTSTTNGQGPNGVLVTPNRRLWAGDGNSLAQVADVDPNSPAYLTLLKPGGISTAIPACDTGATHYCGRADELAFDPKDHVIMIANNAPLSPTLLCNTTPPVMPPAPVPHCAIDPYATFINSDFPYNVLGHITFPGAGGLEQPLWDAELQRFLVTVPGNIVNGVVVVPASIQVVNPKTLLSEATYAFDCKALANVISASITGIALAPYQHILVSACGFPVILTLNAKTTQINPLNVITAVGGGDEVWHNPGDGRFYVTGADMTTTAGVQSLGVIDAETSSLLQILPDVRGKNPAGFPENNHIFTIVQINAAIVAAPSTDDSVCTKFGFKGTGCIAVFEHTESGEAQAQ